MNGKGYLDLLRSWSIVAFSLQYCSTNLLLTSVASPGLEEGHNTTQHNTTQHNTTLHRHTHRVLRLLHATPVESSDEDDTSPIGRDRRRVILHPSKLGCRQLGETGETKAEALEGGAQGATGGLLVAMVATLRWAERLEALQDLAQILVLVAPRVDCVAPNWVAHHQTHLQVGPQEVEKDLSKHSRRECITRRPYLALMREEVKHQPRVLAHGLDAAGPGRFGEGRHPSGSTCSRALRQSSFGRVQVHHEHPA